MLGFLKPDPIHPAQFLHLIGEKTAPNFFWSDDTRCENRNNRTVPVSISAWTKGKPDPDSEIRVVTTKDISDNGLCLIAPFTISEPEVVLGIFVKATEIEEPLFFRVSVVKNIPFAKGLWQIGVRAEELLNPNYPRQIKKMTPMTMELLTPATEMLADV